MVMKNIILSGKEAGLLESLIINYGRVVSFKQVKSVFKKDYSEAEIKNKVSKLAKIGWLVRFKKGLYGVVSDIGSLAVNNISDYTICNALNKDSYVAFESALQFHGMFDQMLSETSAITFKRARQYKIKGTEIRFFKIKKELYFGFNREKAGAIGQVNIASKEKTILDILYFRSNAYYAGLVWSMLVKYKQKFDFCLMKRYSKKFNLNVIRQTGFFLEKLGIDAENLEKLVRGKTNYGRMTRESKEYNAKWRLYFDRSVIE